MDFGINIESPDFIHIGHEDGSKDFLIYVEKIKELYLKEAKRHYNYVKSIEEGDIPLYHACGYDIFAIKSLFTYKDPFDIECENLNVIFKFQYGRDSKRFIPEQEFMNKKYHKQRPIVAWRNCLIDIYPLNYSDIIIDTFIAMTNK